ncbi:MAG: TolC family protein [Rubricoccaceae bacterium]
MSRPLTLCAALLWPLLAGLPAAAQAPVPAGISGPLTLSLADALEIAAEQSYAIRAAALDIDAARAQVREAYGSLFPRADASASYTRNIVQANPFAGSDAGNIFTGLGAIGWLAFNETARTDGDPDTEPITLAEYNRRVREGQAAAGFVPSPGSNPFAVDNQFQNSLSLSQPLYSGVAFAAVRGARSLVEINEAALAQRQQETTEQVTRLFYGALLAQEQQRVVAAAVDRARETQRDFSLLVAQGVRPALDRLNAEVDLANAETQLVQARAQADAARDQLLFALGLPVGQPLVLRGTLAEPEPGLFRTVGLEAAAEAALEARPDLRQARLAVRLQQVQRDITRAALQPSVSAFATLAYVGNVPDGRTSVFAPDPADPFSFEQRRTGFFSGDYWNPSVSAGLRLNWTLFDGFQTRYRAQQNTVAIRQAEIALAQATEGARLEVAQALRTLESARQRLVAQRQTVETAELAYDFAQARLREGVATLVDVRLASGNLDAARLNYLQAVHDALVARAAYERATGSAGPRPLPPPPTTAAR